jgi:hypothetical protein
MITCLVVGLLGRSATAIVVMRQRKGFGIATNLALGIVERCRRCCIPRLFAVPAMRFRPHCTTHACQLAQKIRYVVHDPGLECRTLSS